MKFGLCRMEDARKFNADYAELNAAAVYKMTEEEFSALKEKVKKGELTPYAVNGLVPGDVRLTGPEVDFAKIREYAEKCFGRLCELGIKLLVFGSSAPKNVPEGFPMEKAWEQLFEVGKIFSDVAEKYGQTIAVEGLRRQECNIINTLEEVYYYVEKVNRKNFLMLCDFYHVSQNGENVSDVKKYKGYLVHCHIAGYLERAVPTEKELPFIKECITALKEMGYEGGVSFEGTCDTKNAAQLTEMFNSFKKYAE